MADAPGILLQRELRRQIVAALGRVREDLDGQQRLRQLGAPGPEWAGSGLEDRLRARLQDITVENPLAAAVLRTLLNLTTTEPGAVAHAELHGWSRVAGTEPDGIAWAARLNPAGGGLAFAVHVTDDGSGPRLGLSASGLQAVTPVTVPLAAGWSATFSGRLSGALELGMDGDGGVILTESAPGDAIDVDFERPDTGARIGTPPTPSVRLGAVTFGGGLVVEDGPSLRRTGRVGISGGAVELAPGELGAIVPGLGPLPLSLTLGLDPQRGLTVAGSAELRARLPVALSAPGVKLDGLDLVGRLAAASAGEPVNVSIEARTAVTVSLPGVPIELRFEGLGLGMPFAFGDLPAFGFSPDLADLPALLPEGAGARVDLPIVRAAGGVRRLADGQYVGSLSASVPPMEATAFGILRLRPLSFLVMLGATFRPGIQIGFGFAISGIGGVVGVNRRVDRDGLLRSVVDGTAADLLFPVDPAKSAKRAETALERIFPPARGSVVAGPMFKISWGEQLVTASVAVLMEISAQPRLTILGKLVVAIPDARVPLVLLQATFSGQFDPGEPSILIVAGLTGSHIAGVPFDGDLCLLTRGGREATFVLSAGGFHPAFPLPRGVPSLRRIGTDLSTLAFLELRCEAYLAITTNTVQFGARVELRAQVAGCGLRGHLAFDALIQVTPFHFVIDISFGVALTVFGEELVGVALDLRLEGPAKWHVRGRGSVDLFFFDVPFDFDEEWGQAPGLTQGPREIEPLLRAALAEPGAWSVHRPSGPPAGVVLTEAADHALTAGEAVDPHGSVGVRQNLVPLGLRIDRFDRIPLGEPQTWDLTGGTLGPGASEQPPSRPIPERFAAAQFLTLTDDQALSWPAFEWYRAGLEVAGGPVVMDDPVPHAIGFETSVFVDEPDQVEAHRFVGDGALGPLLAAVFAAAHDTADPTWWPPPDAPVSIAEAPPLAVASPFAMTSVAMDAGPTAAEMHQEIGGSDLMVVEAWEVQG